ncbi:hypothetical protein OH77DRAFT_1423272, partial [Trametes cingulata]
LAMLDGLGVAASPRGVRWADALAQMKVHSSVRVSPADFQEVIRELEQEGLVKVTDERDRRMMKRVEGA